MKQNRFWTSSALSAVFMALAVSCGPSAYTISVETSRPSASGVDLAGKTVSVVYLDSGAEPDSLFAASMASSFVSELEKEYFGGDSLVPLFCLDRLDNVDYSAKSSMVDLLVDTGADVLFLLDAPAFGADMDIRKIPAGDGSYTAAASVPFSVNLYVYDSMDKRDTVLLFSGSTAADISAPVSGNESEEGLEYILKSNMEGTASAAGAASGRKFAPAWKSEEIVFFMYGSQAWYNTYYYVNDYQWQMAMDVWMSMLGTPDMEKRACLEYNLAAACYMQGQYRLALEWLELSREHFALPYVNALEEKITSRLM